MGNPQPSFSSRRRFNDQDLTSLYTQVSGNGGYLKLTAVGAGASAVKEQWKKHPIHTHIETSNKGRVRNSINGLVYKQAIDRYGYPKLAFTYNGKKWYYTVHRLVAESWVPNPENKPQVNHKDGIKTNNSPSNLEWNTEKENINHSYDNSLNKNKISVIFTDTETSETVLYRSLKEVAKKLGIYPSALVPLIRYSNINPIFGRYILKITDEEALWNTSNTVNFGKPLYVLDLVEEVSYKYSSSLMAAYFTSIRSLGLFTKGLLKLSKLGYIISDDKSLITDYEPLVNKEEVIEYRNNYRLIPYTKRDPCYLLYDYYNKKEYSFDLIQDVLDFLNRQEPTDHIVTLAAIRSCFCLKEKTKLAKGFGTKPIKSNLDWHIWPEEVILSSKYGCFAPTAVYEVIKNENKTLVFSAFNLCRFLGIRVDGSESHVKLNKLLQSFNSPDISFKRLTALVI